MSAELRVCADATGTLALLVCLATGALYQQAPLQARSATRQKATQNKAEKTALLPK